ncbi:hypothetical protein Fmac_016791 [Flemingia macrophylla]|uniref:Pentatricopeptide repeat-containing protein n=1 Tax=Flemingia macrophylla TaxID=520843 RepID=A0ABD1MIE0_9FABA
MEDNGCIPNAITFEIIICALFQKDENDKAEKLLLEMIARGLLVDFRFNVRFVQNNHFADRLQVGS